MTTKIYVLTDNSGNQIIDTQLTPEMVEKLEVRGIKLEVFTRYKTLKDDHYRESEEDAA